MDEPLVLRVGAAGGMARAEWLKDGQPLTEEHGAVMGGHEDGAVDGEAHDHEILLPRVRRQAEEQEQETETPKAKARRPRRKTR